MSETGEGTCRRDVESRAGLCAYELTAICPIIHLHIKSFTQGFKLNSKLGINKYEMLSNLSTVLCTIGLQSDLAFWFAHRSESQSQSSTNTITDDGQSTTFFFAYWKASRDSLHHHKEQKAWGSGPCFVGNTQSLGQRSKENSFCPHY